MSSRSAWARYGRTGSTHVLVEPVDQVGRSSCDIRWSSSAASWRRHHLDEPDLAVGVEVAEHLGPVARGQDAEEGVALVGLEVLDQLGDPARVMVGEEVAQAGDLAVVDQLAEVGNQERISHRSPSVSGPRIAAWFDRIELGFDVSRVPPITSLPTNGRRTSGTSIRPSARW